MAKAIGGKAERTASGALKPRKKPRLGQNFLVDESAAAKIVETLEDVSRAIVIEIGPGKGAITRALVERAGKLVAIEYDRQLAAMLKYEFLNVANLEVIEADVLTVDFHALLRGKDPKTPVRVVGNLPFYITSDILLKLFAAAVGGLIEQIVVMVQKEVAERITAPPGSRNYGLLSATAQMHARVRQVITLPPAAFAPSPKVHSAVVDMKVAPRFAELGVDARGFDAFLKLVFGQKRKTILNNLKNGYPEALARDALEEAGVKTAARAEGMTLEQMAKLYRNVSPAEG